MSSPSLTAPGEPVGGLPPGATLHPWNDAFVWALPATSPSTIRPEDKAAFDRDGFLLVTDVLGPGELAVLIDELDGLEAKVDRFLADQQDERVSIAERGAITFTVHAVLRSPAARAFARHETIVGLAVDLVGSDVNLYWDQAVYKKPEKRRRFPWHQDTGYTFVEPQHYLTCWVALTDATVENGCPWVLPAGHRSGTLRHRWIEPIGWECFEDAPGAVPVEIPAGALVAFSSLTPHSTGPNRTASVRKAYILQYGPAGMQVVQGDWMGGADPATRAPCDDPDRQFPVARMGRPV
jgi:phytanoyl-CoA hydroxylase